MANNSTIKLTFNTREVEAPEGVSVLRAAELNDIYIPTLCSHKDLSPFGGCRLCIVEIEGMRGYPLSCSTIATDGMVVITETEAIREIRTELVQLILSEHPSSCLICGESDECKTFMKTVRKSGVATGCRYCPNDAQCELQDVVKYLEITEISYPVIYREHEPERMDPFFDRDYNICILCGRCIRMCQEMRGTAVLTFNFRGNKARVGTAFGRNHIEAGCEFCGACITVCPTGALAEKASKWDGIPDGSIITTCPYCAIGCQIELFHKDGWFSKAVPVHDSEVNDGQACLKGRFCLGEVSHHFERARKPMARIDGYWKEQLWDNAIEKAAEKLQGLKPDEFAMLVSPDCTNESLFTAQKFVRTVMKSNSIDSTARTSLGGGLPFWAGMFQKPIKIQEIKKAKTILAIGLDTRFNFSIIGVEIRKAIKAGARLVTINSRRSNLARYSHCWLRPEPATEGILLGALVKSLYNDKEDLKKELKLSGVDKEKLADALELLKDQDDLMVIVGPRIFSYTDNADLINSITELSKKDNVSIIPLYYGTNTRGAIDLGAFPEILPGAVFKGDKKTAMKLESAWKVKLPQDDGITIDKIHAGECRPKVLYLVGAVPFSQRPDCDYLIVQDIYEPDFDADLYLPATSFLESSGTLVNMEGRVQDAPGVEKLPDSVMYGRARPDWWILSQIAKKLDVAGFEYESSDNVLDEISDLADGFPKSGRIHRKIDTFRAETVLPETVPVSAGTHKKSGFLLVMQPGSYSYRGVDITSKVEGLQILNPEEGFHLNSEDAKELGITEGEKLIVKAEDKSGIACARIEDEIPRGAIYLFKPLAFGGLKDRCDLEQLFRLETNPCTVEVKKVGV